VLCSLFSTSLALPTASSSNKIFYLFSAEHEGVNETKLAIPPDTFSPDVLEVTEGDNVTVYFYNLDTTDRHTFTIGSPYNLNEDLLPGKNATFTFKAADEGVFRFYCTYHQPTMSGELVVLPRPAVEKTNAVTK
jgi:plastocyanin